MKMKMIITDRCVLQTASEIALPRIVVILRMLNISK